MKHLYSVLSGCLVVCLSSCSSYINRPPDGTAFPSNMIGVWEVAGEQNQDVKSREAKSYVQLLPKNGQTTTAIYYGLESKFTARGGVNEMAVYSLGQVEASCHSIENELVISLRLVKDATLGSSAEVGRHVFFLLKHSASAYEMRILLLKNVPETASSEEIKTALAKAIQTATADAPALLLFKLKATQLASLPELPEPHKYFAVLREKARAEAANDPEKAKSVEKDLRAYEQGYTLIRAFIESAQF